MSMQVLPTAPSPTVTHLMNLAVLMVVLLAALSDLLRVCTQLDGDLYSFCNLFLFFLEREFRVLKIWEEVEGRRRRGWRRKRRQFNEWAHQKHQLLLQSFYFWNHEIMMVLQFMFALKRLSCFFKGKDGDRERRSTDAWQFSFPPSAPLPPTKK